MGRIAEEPVVGVAALASLVVLALLGPTAGAAQGQSTDPSPGSPAGTIYRLPVDNGRIDAAPRGDGGAGLPASTFRSENNFGTSSSVPGDPRSKGGGGGGGEKGGDDGSGLALSSAEVDTGDTSAPVAFLLLAVFVAVGALLGFSGVRSARRATS